MSNFSLNISTISGNLESDLNVYRERFLEKHIKSFKFLWTNFNPQAKSILDQYTNCAIQVYSGKLKTYLDSLKNVFIQEPLSLIGEYDPSRQSNFDLIINKFIENSFWSSIPSFVARKDSKEHFGDATLDTIIIRIHEFLESIRQNESSFAMKFIPEKEGDKICESLIPILLEESKNFIMTLLAKCNSIATLLKCISAVSGAKVNIYNALSSKLQEVLTLQRQSIRKTFLRNPFTGTDPKVCSLTLRVQEFLEEVNEIEMDEEEEGLIIELVESWVCALETVFPMNPLLQHAFLINNYSHLLTRLSTKKSLDFVLLPLQDRQDIYKQAFIHAEMDKVCACVMIATSISDDADSETVNLLINTFNSGFRHWLQVANLDFMQYFCERSDLLSEMKQLFAALIMNIHGGLHEHVGEDEQFDSLIPRSVLQEELNKQLI